MSRGGGPASTGATAGVVFDIPALSGSADAAVSWCWVTAPADAMHIFEYEDLR